MSVIILEDLCEVVALCVEVVAKGTVERLAIRVFTAENVLVGAAEVPIARNDVEVLGLISVERALLEEIPFAICGMRWVKMNRGEAEAASGAGHSNAKHAALLNAMTCNI